MQSVRFLTVLCILASAAIKPVRPNDPLPASYGLDVAFVRAGVLYMIDRNPGDGLVRMCQIDVRLTKDSERSGTKRTIRDWHADGGMYHLRWRIAHDYVWSYQDIANLPDVRPLSGGLVESHKFPLADVPLLDVRNEKEGEAALRKKYNVPAENAQIPWGMDISDAPIHQKAELLLIQMDPAPLAFAEGTFEADILPTAAVEYDLFMLHRSWMTIWHLGPRGFNEPVTFRAGFQEPFIAYGTSQEPYFVTRSGKAYRLVKAEKGHRKVEMIWSDSERPIKAILTDVDSGRTFVLGVDWRGDKDQRFYFELGPKPQPLEIKDKDWPTKEFEHIARLYDPMLKFARFLDSQKKLRIK